MVAAWAPFGGISAHPDDLADLLNPPLPRLAVSLSHMIRLCAGVAPLSIAKDSPIPIARLLSGENAAVKRQGADQLYAAKIDDAQPKNGKAMGRLMAERGKIPGPLRNAAAEGGPIRRDRPSHRRETVLRIAPDPALLAALERGIILHAPFRMNLFMRRRGNSRRRNPRISEFYD